VDDVTAVYLSGVDPTNEDRVYARAYSPLADELLVSDDGARSFRSVLKLEGGMWGFALSPDGAKVAVGGPTQGTFVAARDALQFERRSLEPVTCLTWDDSGFYGCGAPKVSSFVVGQSQDEGRSWLPLLGKLTDIQGPSAACAPDSPSATTCTGVWPAQQAVWLVQPDAGSKADGSSEADSGTVPPGPPNRNDAGCGVLYAPSGPIGGMAVAAALGALALRRIRPRRGRGAPTRRSETR
jgi:hypothetical protein